MNPAFNGNSVANYNVSLNKNLLTDVAIYSNMSTRKKVSKAPYPCAHTYDYIWIYNSLLVNKDFGVIHFSKEACQKATYLGELTE